ncbi:MAG: hypothetical protein EOL95_09840 [Bacteroidia bacterium]|nr:hypothetical protein [Bacteroidia bacterium]
MKTKWIIVIIAVVLVLSGVSCWFFGWYMPGKNTVVLPDTPEEDKLLKNGDSGADVCRLQNALNKWRNYVITNLPNSKNTVTKEALAVDGMFGKMTLAAVRLQWGKDFCSITELSELEGKA